MPPVRSRALVLQAFAYGETSKILRLYTLDLGLRSVIAKGAQRPKSRYGGVLEPFTEGDAEFYLREGRDLHTLGGFDLIRSRQALGRDLAAFAGASLVAELVLRYSTEEPHPELYHAAAGALDRIALAEPSLGPSVALGAAWEMISLLGYHPELEACVGCGRAFAADEPSRFDVEAGGSACTACRPTGRVVDPTTRRQVASMSHGAAEQTALSDAALHRALLRAFIGAHLSGEHPLRSLDLFLDQVR